MGKKHPLDIFRAHPVGFPGASGDRRTLAGRVVASTPRPEGRAPPPTIAASRERAAAKAALRAPAASAALPPVAVPSAPGRRPLVPPVLKPANAPASAESAGPSGPTARPAAARPSTTASNTSSPTAARPTTALPAPSIARPRLFPARSLPLVVNRLLLTAALVVVGGLTVWIAGVSFGGGPSLKSDVPAQPAGSPASAPAPAGPVEFTVVAASFEVTPVGQTEAFAARDYLKQRGFRDVQAVGIPGSQPGQLASIEVHVGRASAATDLVALLESVRREQGWKAGAGAKPFARAEVRGFAQP